MSRLPIFGNTVPMGKNTSISLTERHQEYLRAKVESGEFASASEVVREALRRAEERDRKREALDRAIQEGLDSGPPQPFDFDEFLKEMRANYKAD